MPCSDVTEIIEIQLDAEDRIGAYQLFKQTCGRAVGDASLLMPKLVGLRADVVAATDPEDFVQGAAEGLDTFLAWKHILAVQAALRVLAGAEPGGSDDLCAAADIASDGSGVTLRARIRVALVTSAIPPCHGPKGKGCGCSSRKSRAAASSSPDALKS